RTPQSRTSRNCAVACCKALMVSTPVREPSTQDSASTASLAVQTVGLRKEYGAIVAVENLDLTINRGEVFGMLGPNGSGKTTTIRMLCGLVRPTRGSAQVVGLDVVANPEAVR